MKIEPESFTDLGWTIRYLPPKDPTTARVLLLLHGRTGDEKVMWIFTRALAGHFWLFAPRAPLQDPDGGFAWLPHAPIGWPDRSAFKDVSTHLLSAYDRWSSQVGVPEKIRQQPFSIMGFSQGGAMALALAAYHPRRIDRVAVLAGFLPSEKHAGGPDLEDPDFSAAFRGRRIYLAHGNRDEIVPIRKAHEAIAELTRAGADITFCESDVGHKLSLDCAKGLDTFFR